MNDLMNDNLAEAVEHFLRREHYDGAPWFVEQSQIAERVAYLGYKIGREWYRTIIMITDKQGLVICDPIKYKKELINAALQALKLPITVVANAGPRVLFSTPWGMRTCEYYDWIKITTLLNPYELAV